MHSYIEITDRALDQLWICGQKCNLKHLNADFLNVSQCKKSKVPFVFDELSVLVAITKGKKKNICTFDAHTAAGFVLDRAYTYCITITPE